MKTTETFSPTLAKLLLSIASVLGTLGGWAVLSLGSTSSGEATKTSVPVTPPARAEQKLSPVAQPAKGVRALRRVDVPPSAPVTFTRSSR